MKYLFLIAGVVLLVSLILTEALMPQKETDLPVIYWTTDPNPARVKQVSLFEAWLKERGYPPVRLLLDTANGDMSKQVIQGVSGVAGDVIDTSAFPNLSFFREIGLTADVTDAGIELGFDPSQTYEAVRPLITHDGRQYAFPCNVICMMYWVNVSAFEELGIEPPPRRWSLDDFERIGKAFVAAANEPGERQTRFFADRVDRHVLIRSLGLSVYNETLTACTLDDARNTEVLRRTYQWTNEDGILPSVADRASIATDAGYGGQTLQLFNGGNFGLFFMGRYALIQLRRFGDLKLRVSEPPNGGFPNTVINSRSAFVYQGTSHPEAARQFLAFLASETYNMQIVRDGDALPPSPQYTEREEFLRPPDHPNEWGVHEAFADAAKTIAIPSAQSPFVLSSVAERIELQIFESFMTGQLTAEEASAMMAERINREMTRTLEERPEMRAGFERRVELQKRIDAARAAGEPIPREWISNPFYQKYFQEMGWLQ